MGKNQRNCIQRLCCYATILLIVATIAALTWYFAFFAKKVDADIASCGSCHCIPDDDSNTCPSATATLSEFNQDQINTWKSQTAINPFSIDCNPFEDGTFCDTEPPLNTELLGLGDVAVCAIHYESSIAADGNTQVCENAVYRLQTYASRQEAEAAGGFVTHLGHCGVCSTMQDMAVYAEHLQPTSPGNFCRRQSFTSLENGIACYRTLGMTQDCAKIWADTSWNTAKNCFGICVVDPTIPDFGYPGSSDGNNEDEPIDFNSTGISSSNTVAALEGSSVTRTSNHTANSTAVGCEVNACWKCDLDSSALFFERYAGRSRRRSGLLGTDVIPCNTLAAIAQDSCPVTRPLQ
jgi:hypothetical protein